MIALADQVSPVTGRLHLSVRSSGAALGVSAFAVTGGLAAANGGFFPSSWGWAAIALLWVSVVALVARPAARLRRAEVALALSVTALAGWTWLSILWSSDRTQSVLEGERALVPLAAVAAVLAVAQRRPVRPLVTGLGAAIALVCAYALATRLIGGGGAVGTASTLAGYRLARPVGYWNGLGVLAGMGALISLGVVSQARSAAARAAGAVGLLVFLPTLAFTFSRGSWIALGAGAVVLLALDPARLRSAFAILVCSAAPAVAVALALGSRALTDPSASAAAATAAGHRLALALLALAAIQVLVAFGLNAAQTRVRVPRPARVAFAVMLVAVAVGAPTAVIATEGGPLALVRHVSHSFAAPPKQVAQLDQRLLSFSGTGRWTLWRVAWEEVRANPVLGGGAGSYSQYWLAHRPVASEVQDAHNLYLETLAELGPVGLGALLSVLGISFAAAVRNRRRPLVPAAAAVLAAYAVHASVDWDWELAGVTLAAILAATACVVAGRERTDAAPEPTPGLGRRGAAIAALSLLAVAALVGLLGNAAAARSESAARAGDWPVAERYAHRAIRWAPWSSVGWHDLAQAQLGRRRLPEARVSLRRAIERDPGNWVLWLDLGAASKGEARRAALDRARALDPLSPELVELESALARV